MRLTILSVVLSLLVGTATPAFAQTPLETLSAARQRYGTPMTKGEAAELLNLVAWSHREAGWRLLGKRSGNNCPQPQTGALISCDFLVHVPSLQGYDVLIAEDESGIPSWQGPNDLTGAITNGSRTIVEPVLPMGAEPTPTNPQPTPSLDLAALLRAIQDGDESIRAKIDAELERTRGESEKRDAEILKQIVEHRAEVRKTYWNTIGRIAKWAAIIGGPAVGGWILRAEQQ